MTAVTFQENRKKGYLALIALAAIFFLIFIVFRHGTPKKEGSGASAPNQANSSLAEIEINFDIFKNPFFENALPFEKIKPFEGQIGRENPFAPYPVLLPTSTATSTTATTTPASSTSSPPVVPIDSST